ncbi:hypothetical protein [Catellatospora citrea]|uniref:Uncharacterized protein n=1 Tax=Catellatospora citrea TaxID=53366 RepID=A0A8J3KHH5_9ACTN|nr:hypothetical protein [Catellatospora citrea]RKE09694.1 hypothetical protein C8E86_4584 [Catellatospora citrea]GIG03267.1 hypothetical protein Cci01nite_83600 [Catellatospora citrea]
MLSGQLDLFTGQRADPPPPAAPRIRRPAAPLAPGEIRYRVFAGQRDCADCWSAQTAASKAGAAMPFRRHATCVRESAEGKTHLCAEHKAARQGGER